MMHPRGYARHLCPARSCTKCGHSTMITLAPPMAWLHCGTKPRAAAARAVLDRPLNQARTHANQPPSARPRNQTSSTLDQ
eukprot:98951-Chlamydomonas_euryale.AAC.1